MQLKKKNKEEVLLITNQFLKRNLFLKLMKILFDNEVLMKLYFYSILYNFYFLLFLYLIYNNKKYLLLT